MLSQKERLETLKDTLLSRAEGDLSLENTGRHAKPNTVIGSPSAQYPRLPENSWTNDPTGVEPPLGIDVNAVEPCGEKFEIEALDDVTTVFDGQSVASSLAGADERPIVSNPSDDVEPPPAPASPNPKPKPRGA